MKRKMLVLIVAVGLTVGILHGLGIGFYSSSSAVLDLKEELEEIYGPEYNGKTAENGTEEMVFEVEPKTWFLTNWNLRNALGLDYQYECRVIYTTHCAENAKMVRVITYQASDPMGAESLDARASLNLDSKTETTQVK